MRSYRSMNAFLMLIVSGGLVGLGPVIAKLIAAPAISIVLYRIALPIPVLYIIMKIKGRVTANVSATSTWRDKVRMACVGFFFALDLTAFYVSLRYTSVAAATLLSNLSPLFLMSYILIRKRRLGKELIWLLISVIGLIFLCGTKNMHAHSEVIGYLAALSAAGFFSFYILLINKMGASGSSVDIMLWSSIGGAGFLLLICLFFNIDIRITATSSIINIILLAFGVQLIGQTMLTKAISIFPPEFSALGILIDPVAASFFSWIILHEPLTLLEILGAALILIGIVGSYKFQKNENNILL